MPGRSGATASLAGATAYRNRYKLPIQVLALREFKHPPGNAAMDVDAVAKRGPDAARGEVHRVHIEHGCDGRRRRLGAGAGGDHHRRPRPNPGGIAPLVEALELIGAHDEEQLPLVLQRPQRRKQRWRRSMLVREFSTRCR